VDLASLLTRALESPTLGLAPLRGDFLLPNEQKGGHLNR